MSNLELLKLFLEKPGKFGVIALNLLRLILTLMFINSIPGFFKFNFTEKIFTFGNIHIGYILLYVFLLVIFWAAIWELLPILFSFLITLRKKKSIEQRSEEIRSEKKEIRELLILFKVYSNDNKFIVPSGRIYDVIDFLRMAHETNTLQLAKSGFSNVFYLLFVTWLFLVFNFVYVGISPCWHLLFIGVLYFLGFIFRSIDKVLMIVEEHFEDVLLALDQLEYKRMVIDTVTLDFKGRVNYEEKSFSFNWGKNAYQLFDFYYYHPGLGEAYILKYWQEKRGMDIRSKIIVLNFPPSERVEHHLYRELGAKAIVVANDYDELMNNLTSKLNELEYGDLTDSKSKTV